MQSDSGKLFVGGISWDTNEERLKEYFSSFGDVVEAVIMKDRTTGRARGFGFVVFVDPAVAERVIQEKHNIDGRMVEAKKAVPRDDQNIIGRNSSSNHGSPGPGRTRKIFVGGLASTVTEGDFKKYFEQFGTVTDVVVMYDHNTQRPRGFGFITYNSEEAVDKVLFRTFHELNGKLVEVKRAIPKELSLGPSRSPVAGYNYITSRASSVLNGYIQGYSPNTIGDYGLGMDVRFSQLSGGRSGFSSVGSGYETGVNFEPGLRPGIGGNASFNSNLSYGRGLSPYYTGNLIPNRFSNPTGYDNGSGGGTSLLGSTIRNSWGNGGLNYGINSSSNAYLGVGNTFGDSGVNWVSSAISAQDGGIGVSKSMNLGHGGGVSGSYGPGTVGYGRNGRTNAPSSSSVYESSNGGVDGSSDGFYSGGSVYGDLTWQSSNSERDGSAPFGYGIGNAESSPGYVGGFGINKRHPKEELLPRMMGFDITT